MQLIVNEVAIPERITFNYDELKQELAERVHLYETTVYGDDQIKAAKADRAALNRLKKALNDERIRREKEYMKPFDDFKAQINEIIGIIDKPVALIDKQVKDYESRKQEEKTEEIKRLWESVDGVPEWLTLGQVWNPKWLNATYKLTTIEEELKKAARTVAQQTGIIMSLEEFSFEAMEVYKQTLDIGKAVNEGKRLADIQRRKRDAERAEKERREKEALQNPAVVTQEEFGLEYAPYGASVPEQLPAESEAEPEPEIGMNPPEQWIRFEALLTVDKAVKLKAFCDRNGIELRSV